MQLRSINTPQSTPRRRAHFDGASYMQPTLSSLKKKRAPRVCFTRYYRRTSTHQGLSTPRLAFGSRCESIDSNESILTSTKHTRASLLRSQEINIHVVYKILTKFFLGSSREADETNALTIEIHVILVFNIISSLYLPNNTPYNLSSALYIFTDVLHIFYT